MSTNSNTNAAKGKKKNFKPRGKKFQKTDKFNRESDKFSVENGGYSKSNDPAWYSNNPQLVKDVASLSFGSAVGTKQNRFAANAMNNVAIPGICVLNYVPAAGYGDNATSPLNVASRNLMTFIRQMNSGAKNYDAPDLMLYILAMDQGISFLEWMKRIYGVLRIYNPVNRYYPKAIVEAMDVDFDDLLNNIADFRAFVNMYATKLSALPVPANMSYTYKHKWLNSSIFTDSPSPKAQTYIFNPEGFWIYSLIGQSGLKRANQEDAPIGSGYLEYVDRKWFYDKNLVAWRSYDRKMLFSDIVRYANMILDPLLYTIGDQDFNTIGGDILKAYTPSGVYRAELISEDYVTLPIYDETVLMQIQNLTMYGYFGDVDPANNTHYDVWQDADARYLVTEPHGTWLSYKYYDDYLMDRYILSHGAALEPAQVMEASRLSTILVEDTTHNVDDEVRLNYECAGSEIITRAFIFFYGHEVTEDGSRAGAWELRRYYELNSDYGRLIRLDDIIDGSITPQELAISTAYTEEMISALSQFDWHPLLVHKTQVQYEDPKSPGEFLYANAMSRQFFGDVNNYAIVSEQDLRQLSEVALLSQFGIEGFGRK